MKDHNIFFFFEKSGKLFLNYPRYQFLSGILTSHVRMLGPVVQSMVSIMSSLRSQLKCFATL